MDRLASWLHEIGGPAPGCSSVWACSALSPTLCNPILWILQIQSSLTMIGIGIAWLWASQSRVRESRRIKAAQRAGNPLAFVNSDVATLSHEKQRQLPKVTVVLAVKGASEQSLANWRSQLVTLYGGQLEYMFCVESKEDAAYGAVQNLQKEMAGVCNVRLVVAGLATSCSQQIHNQMAGAEAAAPDSKYLLFLDDDIQVHPGTIGSLVNSLEQRPEVFVCTGYSFDVPSTPSIAAYAAMCYRLPLLIGMSSGGPCFFVWGGCIMLRTADLRTNRHGVHTALKKNGYSNDLILTSVAGLNRRAVWCPAVALFPGRMSGDWDVQRYWNYVRRQIFALLTYCSSYAYRTNRTGWVCYSYLAMGLVLPLIPSIIHVAHSLGFFSSAAVHALASGSAAEVPLGAVARTAFSWSAATVARQSFCPIGLALAWANIVSMAFSAAMCTRLFFAAITLCNLLSPEKKPIDIKSLSLVYGLLGMLMNMTLMPVIAVYTWWRKDISWAGIRYVRKGGVVASVEHPHQLKLAALQEKSVEEQEMIALEDRDVDASQRFGGKLGSVDLVQQLKQDLESQLAEGEDQEKSYGMNAFAKGGGGVLMQIEGWLKTLPILGRALSPRTKKIG